MSLNEFKTQVPELIPDLVVADLPCNNPKCEKYLQWVFPVIEMLGAEIEVECFQCGYKYKTKL